MPYLHSANEYIGRLPQRYRLPGNINANPSLRRLAGPLQESIAGHLCYYGIPRNIDANLERLQQTHLPKPDDLVASRNLSLFVYGIKQMMHARTIVPDQAWSLFFSGPDSSGSFSDERFLEVKNGFLGDLRNEKTANSAFLQDIAAARLSDNADDSTLFEFWARTGAAGLSRYAAYAGWREALQVSTASIKDPEEISDLSEAHADEYAKALWLEMRLIEHAFGYRTGADKNIFVISGLNCNSLRSLYADIDLRGRLDFVLKAEIGHWMMGPSELADRSNVLGFSEATDDFVGIYLKTGMLENLPPVARTFIEGGYYHSSLDLRENFGTETEYPLFPQAYPRETVPIDEYGMQEPHEKAEYTESMIRKHILGKAIAGEIPPDRIHQSYREMVIYLLGNAPSYGPDCYKLERMKEAQVRDIHEYAQKKKSETLSHLRHFER